jgi:hypothetical protein
MQKLESNGSFQTAILAPSDPTDKNSYKVRKGKIGGYKDELSNLDIEYVESATKKLDHYYSSRYQ